MTERREAPNNDGLERREAPNNDGEGRLLRFARNDGMGDTLVGNTYIVWRVGLE